MEEQAGRRGRPRRTWVKLHCDGILRGSINYQLELSEQAVWMKMLALAAICGGKDGWIQDNNEKPVPHLFIADELHCPVEIFESTLTKCIADDRCRENSRGIEIVNWANYQSEYSRQKPSREAKKRREQTLDQKLEQEFIQEVGIRFRKKKKELGRELTTPEGQAIKDEIRTEIFREGEK